MGSVLRLVGQQQTGGSGLGIGIGGAAEPYIGAGVAVFLGDLRLYLTGGQTLIAHLDAVQLFKMLAGGGHVGFLGGAGHDQLAFGRRGGKQVGVHFLSGGERRAGQRHHSGQKQCQELFHGWKTSSLL